MLPLPELSNQKIETIKSILLETDTKIIAHYYTPPVIQHLAELTHGFVGDSLEMAKFGASEKCQNLLVCGVKFMGETAKILSPHKNIIMPTLEATCSLDLGCPATEFLAFCNKYQDHTVVVYANTSAAVKAHADWVVTSSIALEVIDYLDSHNHKIIWAPDKYLGSYIEKQLNVKMLNWQGSCIVHEEFKAQGIINLKNIYPEADILVHPESPPNVIQLADATGSTTALIRAAKASTADTLIVATDKGIFYKMQQAVPHKKLIAAPTAGESATCKSCAMCPWMAMNDVDSIMYSLENMNLNTVQIDASTIEKASVPLNRMLNFQMNH